MDYRQEAFRVRFAAAGKWFGVAPTQVVSLKLRENVGSYTEYQSLFEMLQHEMKLSVTQPTGDYQGPATLLTRGKSSVILVKHETGLEILYIVGSLASVVGLVPLVLKAWNSARSRYGGRGAGPQSLEVRTMDNTGKFSEQTLTDLRHSPDEPQVMSEQIFLFAAEAIEEEVRQLKTSVQEVSQRIDSLEKRISREVPAKKSAARKGKTQKGPKS